MTPKYNIGETVFTLNNNKIREVKITAVAVIVIDKNEEGDIKEFYFGYSDQKDGSTSVHFSLKEENLFNKKADLLKSL